jgi:hypothetical protein
MALHRYTPASHRILNLLSLFQKVKWASQAEATPGTHINPSQPSCLQPSAIIAP